MLVKKQIYKEFYEHFQNSEIIFGFERSGGKFQ